MLEEYSTLSVIGKAGIGVWTLALSVILLWL
jgi:hypothetical protein